MKQFFDTVIKPKNDKLREMLDGEALVNDLDHYKDKSEVVHVRVEDEWTQYHLENGRFIKVYDYRERPF